MNNNLPKAGYILDQKLAKLMGYIKMTNNENVGVLTYLEMVYGDSVVEQSTYWAPNNINMDIPAPEIEPVKSISLKTNTLFIELIKNKIDVLEGQDPSLLIHKKLLGDFISKIKELALLNKDQGDIMSPLFITGDFNLIRQKLITKILSCSNYIASKSRLGPANYIIVPSKFEMFLKERVEPEFDSIWQSIPLLNIRGLDIFISNALDNNIIIGRYLKDHDNGLHLISSDDRLEGYLDVGLSDIESVTVPYLITTVGKYAKNNYAMFEFKPTLANENERTE